ncbi:MAG: hypothetical protein K8T20_01380 [Planctomycetes bacterium]|nr:hypothetical protein [Planctomycetota bacterium]
MKRALPISVTLSLVVLAPLPCLAYGGWNSTEYGGMFRQMTPLLVRGFLVTFVPYAILSVWMEKAGRMGWVPLLSAVIGLGLLLPELVSMGERGPSHLVVPYIGAAALLLMGVLLGKFAVLSVLRRAEPRDTISTPPPVYRS